MKRSLVQAGSSLAVTLPVDVVQAFGLRKGLEVDVTVHPGTGAITIRPGVLWLERGEVGPEFRALAEEIVGRRAALVKKASR